MLTPKNLPSASSRNSILVILDCILTASNGRMFGSSLDFQIQRWAFSILPPSASQTAQETTSSDG
jgi:hypothetical protein